MRGAGHFGGGARRERRGAAAGGRGAAGGGAARARVGRRGGAGTPVGAAARPLRRQWGRRGGRRGQGGTLRTARSFVRRALRAWGGAAGVRAGAGRPGGGEPLCRPPRRRYRGRPVPLLAPPLCTRSLPLFLPLSPSLSLSLSLSLSPPPLSSPPLSLSRSLVPFRSLTLSNHTHARCTHHPNPDSRRAAAALTHRAAAALANTSLVSAGRFASPPPSPLPSSEPPSGAALTPRPAPHPARPPRAPH